MTQDSKIKLILALALLACLLPMPYWYYQLVRVGSAICFGYFSSNVKNRQDWNFWVYIGLAVLFQPIIKMALGRTIWNVVDVVVATWLVYGIYNKPNYQDSSE